MTTNIDKRLTEVNIYKLINRVGLPFYDISDEEIKECINNQIFLETPYIYDIKGSFCRHPKTYHLSRIATIVNEIQNNRYDYNYPIEISDNWDIDESVEHYIRAFYYCKKNIYMLFYRCS